MTPRNCILTTLLAALVSPASLAQFVGTGGLGGFGGNGGFGSLGIVTDSQGAPRSSKLIWRPWLNVSGSYVENTTYINDAGTVTTIADSFAASGGWGISGSKSIDSTALELTYMGSALVRSGASDLRGTSHLFVLGASHRFNRNFYAGFQQLLGSSLGGYGFGSGFSGIGIGPWGFGALQSPVQGGLPGFGNSAINGFVDDEVFANRVNFSGSFGSAGYRLGLRSNLSFSGGAALVRRRDAMLADTNIYSGSVSYAYALSQKTELGAGYSLATFKYPNRFGTNVVQGTGLYFGRRLGPRTGILGSAGITLFTSEFVGVVQVDPELSEALGVTGTASVVKARRSTFTGGLTAFHRTDLANFSFFLYRGVVPGNGILYGGVRDIASLGASRTFFDTKLVAGLNGSAGRTSGLVQPDIQLRYQAMVSIGYRFGAGISLTGTGGLRWQRLATNGPYLPEKMASVGISWSAGEYPLFF